MREMNEMYNHPKVKAHLTFTHGEGFGRPLLEASFSGKPIISTNLNRTSRLFRQRIYRGTTTHYDKSS